MFKNISKGIKKFVREVSEDISKIDIQSLFSNPIAIIVLILAIIAVILIFTTLDITLIVKGVISVVIFYFLFVWRKKEE